MRHLLAILLISLCVPVLADDAADRATLAQRLADLLEIRAQYSKVSSSCRQSDADLEKALLDLYARRTAEFGGISPKSAYWPEAREIYRDYMEGACAITAGEKMEPVFVKAYAETMSVVELHAAVEFYSSAAGQAMQAGNRKIFHDITDLAMRGVTKEHQEASLTYRQSMLILKNKYKANPK